MFDPSLGSRRGNRVNLSTGGASSSSSLLENVRAERLAREERVRQEKAALVVQGRWRAQKEGEAVRRELLSHLDELVESDAVSSEEVERRARRLLIMGRWRGGGDMRRRVDKLFLGLVRSGREIDPDHGGIRFLTPIRRDPSYVYIVVSIQRDLLKMVERDPLSSTSAEALAFLETTANRLAYERIGASLTFLSELGGGITRIGWVETLVNILSKLVAASLPKKKHPLLQPVIRLLTAPLSLISPSDSNDTFARPLINRLLAFPALPSAIPLASLTHLSSNLPIFTSLLPYAASHPSVLDEGGLSSEQGKTYFIANLATFGITGGMLARHGAPAAMVWVKVMRELLGGVSPGWGLWAEGVSEAREEDVQMATARKDDSDDEEDVDMPAAGSSSAITGTVPPPSAPKRPRQTRPLLPTNISSKLLLLASSAHMSTLTTVLTSPAAKASTSVLMDFCGFALNLLYAFRGTAKWESTLDALLAGQAGRQLMKRIWREGVRGRWSGSRERQSWDMFGQNPHTSTLLLVTQMYSHYLLLTPDDEFFSPSINPFSLDEVTELSAIWRDLAYWAYMSGVDDSVGSGRKMGNDDERGLITRAVVRVAERNARRQFLPDDHWVMISRNEQDAFIEAAVLEDANLMRGPEDEIPENELPRHARARQKLSKRQMAYLSPKLGLLNNLPMTVPFVTRLEIFRHFVQADRQRLHLEDRVHNHRSRFFNSATIHRSKLAEDGFRQLNSLCSFLKGRINITFVNEFGEEEMGVDGGGLFKEFLTGLSKEVFDTQRGLWLVNNQNELYPHPHEYATEAHQLSWYSFIGRILGKALYEGILVDVSFAGFFLAKWLGRQSYLDDLNSLDPELYKGLTILKNYPDPDELALNFTISQDEFGVTKTIDLIPGGSDVAVTAENRHEYIQLMCKYKLDRQIAAQSRAFFDGLSDLIDPKWLRMFDPKELQELIGGEEKPIDVDDLRANTTETGFLNSETTRLFWSVVKGFDQEQRRALVQFVTSCGRPPLLGFANLNPKFGIRFAGTDQTRLPSASSCFNLLKLPGYTDARTLRAKLLQAINSGAGFDLS